MPFDGPFDIFGGYDCVRLSGDLDPEGQEWEEITRTGVDGRAFRLTSNKGEVTTLTGQIDCDGMSDADSTQSGLKSLQGTMITITLVRSGTSLDYDNFFAKKVYGFNRQSVGNPVGGTGDGDVLLTFVADVVYGGTGS
jgi:hypothetical protein